MTPLVGHMLQQHNTCMSQMQNETTAIKTRFKAVMPLWKHVGLKHVRAPQCAICIKKLNSILKAVARMRCRQWTGTPETGHFTQNLISNRVGINSCETEMTKIHMRNHCKSAAMRHILELPTTGTCQTMQNTYGILNCHVWLNLRHRGACNLSN